MRGDEARRREKHPSRRRSIAIADGPDAWCNC
jgi:hypothetical protein